LRDDARRVLAAVLQQQKTVINQLIDRRVTDNTNYSAHDEPFIN
jgi:ribosomal protein S17